MSNRIKIKGKRVEPLPKTALKYNGYICDTCDRGYLTLDLHEGVTPMFTQCFATEGCEGRAHSLGYPNGEPPAEYGEPIIHWYKPDAVELLKIEKNNPVLFDHVKRGGLMRKATEHTPDWVRKFVG